MSKRGVTIAVAIACSVVVAACGDDDGSSGTSSSADGKPIKLMTVGPVEAPEFSLPSVPVGAEVAIDEINQAGGINGRRLQLITCNDEQNPNKATLCARQAIKDGVTALVGGFSVFDLKAIPPLERAGIPWIGLTSPQASTQDNLFLLGGEGGPALSGIGMALAQQGCKNIAIVTAGRVEAQFQIKYIEAGIRAGGAKVAGRFEAPAESSDFAPTVSAARSAGADCIGSGTSASESGPLIAAVNAGRKLKLAFASGGLPEAVLKELGKAADGVLATSAYLPFNSKQGVVQTLKEKSTAKAPDVPLDTFVQSGYASVKVLAEAAKDLDEITPESVGKALSGVTGFDTRLGPVVDLTKPNPVPGFERVFNPEIFVLEAENGEYGLAEPEPLDTTPALELLSKR